MIYRDFKGLKISQLAFGTMRLPVINGDGENIDQDAVEKMVKLAFDGGVNYFDTAWGYHNGKSEVAIGKALRKYDRNSYFIADKFPGYDLGNINKEYGYSKTPKSNAKSIVENKNAATVDKITFFMFTIIMLYKKL